MNDDPIWSQWTEWSLSRPHSPRWPAPNRLYRVRNCVRPITDYNGENYHKCPGDFYEVKQNDAKVRTALSVLSAGSVVITLIENTAIIKEITPAPTPTAETTTITSTGYTMTDYQSVSGSTYHPPYDRNILLLVYHFHHKRHINPQFHDLQSLESKVKQFK